jgi:hypothetical protein
MKKFLSLFVLLISSTLTAAPIPFKVDVEPKFIQITEKDGNINSLQVSIVKYTHPNGKKIDFVGVCHVGDVKYYLQLNKILSKYDVVCYELVADKGVRPVKGKKGKQQSLASFLGLVHQMDYVDYSSKKFVHADLSPNELKKIINSRGDNSITLALKVIAEYIAKSNLEAMKNDKQKIDLMSVLSNPNYTKRIMAKNLSSGGSLGPTLDQIIIDDRNKAALKVVGEQLKTFDNISIFYGAAHGKDFDQRLRKMGFKPVKEEWLVAWDLNVTPQEIAAENLRKIIEGMINKKN